MDSPTPDLAEGREGGEELRLFTALSPISEILRWPICVVQANVPAPLRKVSAISGLRIPDITPSRRLPSLSHGGFSAAINPRLLQYSFVLPYIFIKSPFVNQPLKFPNSSEPSVPCWYPEWCALFRVLVFAIFHVDVWNVNILRGEWATSRQKYFNGVGGRDSGFPGSDPDGIIHHPKSLPTAPCPEPQLQGCRKRLMSVHGPSDIQERTGRDLNSSIRRIHI